ncbi:MAG: 4-hydroxyproline epimerase [Holophagaceae bacterium]
MAKHTFACIDAHTCGNPVRVVTGGAPLLASRTMAERRLEFERDWDWIRRGLMFEPRGHDLMSGTMLFPPGSPENDVGVLFIETSGCLPMCGHGTIGTVTVMVEEGLVTPKTPGVLRLEVPAGLVEARYTQAPDGHVEAVRITNVPSFLFATGVEVDCPDLGTLTVDIAYGGNFYALVDPQPNFPGLEHVTAGDLVRWSPVLRERLNAAHEFIHPEQPEIRGLRHLQWTGAPRHPEAHARNAVFYGDKALDRSPCGTGTSARMAQWAAKGKLNVGDAFHHESIIGSLFKGRVEAATKVGSGDATFDAIIPSIEGWAMVTGYNTIFLDDRDPYVHGFSVL